jgi:hypothetical protein
MATTADKQALTCVQFNQEQNAIIQQELIGSNIRVTEATNRQRIKAYYRKHRN